MSDNSNKKGGSAKLASLTARELELAGLVFQCFDGAFPKINYEKLADIAGFKNAQSASACWGPVKKKLMALGEAAAKDASNGDQDGADTGGLTPSKAKASPRKRKTKAENDENGDASSPATKKPRAKKAAKATKAPVDNQDNDEDDNEVVKDEEQGPDGAV